MVVYNLAWGWCHFPLERVEEGEEVQILEMALEVVGVEGELLKMVGVAEEVGH